MGRTGPFSGDLDHDFEIKADPALSRGLQAGAPDVIELPPGYDAATGVRAKVRGEAFVPGRPLCAKCPPKSETLQRGPPALSVTNHPSTRRVLLLGWFDALGHAVSATTTLLFSGISTTSEYHVAHLRPNTPSSPPQPGPSQRGGFVIIDPRTRSAFTRAHVVSGEAVKVSAKTVEVVGGLIKKAVRRNEEAEPQSPPDLPPRNREKEVPTPSSGLFLPRLRLDLR